MAEEGFVAPGGQRNALEHQGAEERLRAPEGRGTPWRARGQRNALERQEAEERLGAPLGRGTPWSARGQRYASSGVRPANCCATYLLSNWLCGTCATC